MGTLGQIVPRLKGMPALPRTARRTLATVFLAIATAAGITLTAAHPAHSATTSPVYSGKGWKAWTSHGIYSISTDPYEIVFATTTARTKLTKYLTGPAAQVTTLTGVPVSVTTGIDTTPVGTCPPRHRIVVHYSYRPTGVRGMSEARACYDIADHSAYGGAIRMDSEYWTSTSWFSANATTNESRRKDAVAHELGHILGLAHPNTDLDKDGVVENYECVKNTAGVKPLMCSPNRGTVPASYAGKFTTEFDAVGLKQLALNWYLRQAP